MEASMSKLKGLTIDQQVEFERRLVKLRNARQAAIEHATAYDAALAEMRNFAGSEGRRADNYAANLGDSWQDKDRADHPPKDAVLHYIGHWYHAPDSLQLIDFDATTAKHIALLGALPLEVSY